MTSTIDQQRLSEAIGAVYDTVIDGGLWTHTIERLCGLIGAGFGSLAVIDPAIPTVRFLASWGSDPHWARLLEEKYAVMMPYYSVLDRFAVGEPFNGAMMERHFDGPDVSTGTFVREWAEPFGVMDSVNTIVTRNCSRYVTLNFGTMFHSGGTGGRELEIARLITPHVRRANGLSDLIDTKSVTTSTFERTLDTLQISVFIVNAKGMILHANTAAGDAVGNGDPISAVRGMIAAVRTEETHALRLEIERATAEGRHIEGSGVVPLRHKDGRPAMAHVLPLHRGDLRPGLIAGAAAAILVTPPKAPAGVPTEALAALFELTSAEVRVVNEIAAGKNRGEAASSLGLADSTVKTHLERIFSKTETSTQQELSRLISDLSAPVVRPPN